MELKDLDKEICRQLAEIDFSEARCHFYVRGDEDENYLVCDVAGAFDVLALAFTTAMAHDHNVELFIRKAIMYLDTYKKEKGDYN
jgi:hypothetical protein